MRTLQVGPFAAGVADARKPRSYLALYSQSVLLRLRIPQIRIDIGNIAEVLDGGSEGADNPRALLLESRGSRENTGEGIGPDAHLPLRQGESVHEGWQEAAVCDGVEEDEIVGNSITAADHRFAVTRIPSEAEARPGIPVGFEKRAARVEGAKRACAGAALGRGGLADIQIGKDVVDLGDAARDLLTETDIERQRATQPPIVLDEEKLVPQAVATDGISKVLRVLEGIALKELRERQKCQRAIHVVIEEAIALDAVQLESGFDGVPAVDVRDDVLILESILNPALRQAAPGSEIGSAIVKEDLGDRKSVV